MVLLKTHKDFFETPIYASDRTFSNNIFLSLMKLLCKHHEENSSIYREISSRMFGFSDEILKLEDVPFLPVQLFKENNVSSIPDSEIYRVLKSSGTTASKPSNIVLDKETAELQSKSLIEIVSQELGRQRLPMVIIDTPNSISRNRTYSARNVAVIGFSQFSSDKCFVFNNESKIDLDKLFSFLQKNSSSPVLFFGFTFLIWEFLSAIKPYCKDINIANGILLHGGGWKKLANLNISRSNFKVEVQNILGIDRVIDYYGMAEQVGSIFMECKSGFFHTTKYSEIVIRNPITLAPLGFNEIGVVQLLSLIPKSYPGHSILTEDLGKLLGADDCNCGRLGKYFEILGRVPKAEVRGCSDSIL